MKKYEIRPATQPLPELIGDIFDPEMDDYCEETPFAPIDSYVWGGVDTYMPEARAYVTWNEEGLQVLMCALEKEIQIKATQFNDEVYEDSCLEFFLQPFTDDPRYLNFEINAGGVALIGLGASRDRNRLPELPEGMNIRASRHRGGWWAIAYTIPKSLFEKIYGRPPKVGSTMRGNFYKCDQSIHPHFGSWSPIVHFRPDFHRPEWFGELTIVPVSGK